MTSRMSPPKRLLADLAGQLLACEESHFAGLAAWAPRIHVVTGRAQGQQLGPGITVIADDATAAAWSEPKAHQPQKVTVAAGSRDRQIAVLDVHGFLTKGDGPDRADLVTLREQLAELGDDEYVHAILLRIDSPGGTVAGTSDLAAEITRVRQVKRVWAFVEDLAAASAYWIASQAERIYANAPTALVGDIGSFIALYDRSKQFADAGIKAIVIRTGKLKGVGFAGTEITDEQKSYLQDLVDKSQAEFDKAIRSGRKIDPRKVATGQLFLAADAQRLGLIDGIRPIHDLLAELAAK